MIGCNSSSEIDFSSTISIASNTPFGFNTLLNSGMVKETSVKDMTDSERIISNIPSSKGRFSVLPCLTSIGKCKDKNLCLALSNIILLQSKEITLHRYCSAIYAEVCPFPHQHQE